MTNAKSRRMQAATRRAHTIVSETPEARARAQRFAEAREALDVAHVGDDQAGAALNGAAFVAIQEQWMWNDWT